ncbi:hypothetical protein M153_2100020543 [Pseudoloma neurophilia]|uniref:Uncharacterized protein n=1 Tax=Pseudoloma neurophilia TaxID=146866 RepID=A0A0R0M806_9MICR|nr:hypothetical protein M153_2100020543 [Pseudoloma neurophilia]
MIVFLLPFTKYKVKLFFKNSNFAQVAANKVKFISDVPFDHLFPENVFFSSEYNENGQFLKFSTFLKKSSNILERIEIENADKDDKHAVTPVDQKKPKRKLLFTRLKQEFPTIFDLKIIKRRNWHEFMNREYFYTIRDSLNEILEDHELVQQILKYNLLSEKTAMLQSSISKESN